jgi:replication initiation protein RepC
MSQLPGESPAGWRAPIRPSGARRLTLDMRVRLDQADAFTGLPHGTAKPLRFLAAFQEAEPYLGLPVHAYKLVAWLVKQTQPQDWEEGSRPIAWPSARHQAEFLGLSPARVKQLNRALFEAGVFVIRDNEQGKRYGRRDPETKRIIEAFGFDLSPLAFRYDEFVRVAAAARVERDRMKGLRRRATLARRAIRQAGEELAAQGHEPEGWRLLEEEEVAALALACRHASRSDELALIVVGLERRKTQAEEWVRELVKPMETNPEGPASEPHHYTTTTLTIYPIKDTVPAQRHSNGATSEPAPETPSPSRRNGPFPESLGLTPGHLIELAPRLSPYVPAGSAALTWPAIVDAADWLGGEMGISRTLWARACQLMGRPYAAVALALVSTRQAGHFTSSPGGYFAGMLRKYEKGELRLAATLWALREAKWGKRSKSMH